VTRDLFSLSSATQLSVIHIIGIVAAEGTSYSRHYQCREYKGTCSLCHRLAVASDLGILAKEHQTSDWIIVLRLGAYFIREKEQ
jgi:hypothetical protein